MRVLAADIGASNARFAIAETGAAPPRRLFERTYPTAQHPGFEAALGAFLAELRAAHGEALAPERAAIAVAGPVRAGQAQLPNLPSWTIARPAIEAWLGLEARVLNDFEALARGLAQASPADWIELQAGEPQPQANIALVGAGTGLGVAALVWDGRRHRPLATEAGHMSFAPQDEAQDALLRSLRARHGRVSAERVLSGPGIAAIHELLEGAPAEPAAASARALDLFVACYGAFAGDVALAFLARGGLYVCGGIAARRAARLAQGDFISWFCAKGRHRALAAAIPVRLVVNEKLGLAGAALAAAAQD